MLSWSAWGEPSLMCTELAKNVSIFLFLRSEHCFMCLLRKKSFYLGRGWAWWISPMAMRATFSRQAGQSIHHQTYYSRAKNESVIRCEEDLWNSMTDSNALFSLKVCFQLLFCFERMEKMAQKLFELKNPVKWTMCLSYLANWLVTGTFRQVRPKVTKQMLDTQGKVNKPDLRWKVPCDVTM